MTHCHSALWFKFVSAPPYRWRTVQQTASRLYWVTWPTPSWTTRFWRCPSCPNAAASLLCRPSPLSSPSCPATSTCWTCAASRLRWSDTHTHTHTHTHTQLFLVSDILWFDSTWFCLCVCEQQDPQSPSPYTAMILHRLAVDCSLEAQNLGFNCTTTQGQVRVDTHTHTHS